MKLKDCHKLSSQTLNDKPERSLKNPGLKWGRLPKVSSSLDKFFENSLPSAELDIG